MEKQKAIVSALPEGTQLSKYRVARKISSGGFSIVYLAQDKKGTSVAIKEYMPAALAQRGPGEFAPNITAENLNVYRIGLKSFFDEGRVLASIVHPNIVRVLDFFRANETVYMVMQFESGRSLQEHVLRNRTQGQKDVMSEPFIRRVFGQVMDGLREVHSNRLLHLDIKPANIYLRMDGTPILLDFGAARQTLQRDVSNTHPMYTPGFAAPELYKRDAEIGPWTDIYGVGASIFACMSGQSVQESVARLKEDKVPQQLHTFRGPYSKELVSIVERCLALNSLERPQSVVAVQQQLDQDVPTDVPVAFVGRAIAKARNVRNGVAKFMKDHDIKWF